MKHTEPFRMPLIKPTLALRSQRNTPSFSWMDTRYMVRANQFSMCPEEKLRAHRDDEFVLEQIVRTVADYQSVLYATASYLIVAFHGPPLVVSQLDTRQTPFPCPRCTTHEGTAIRYAEIVDETVDALMAFYEANPTLPIFITGHSSGAAIATLFAIHVRMAHPTLPVTHLITFGSPRVGNDALMKKGETMIANWFRIMNQLDMIPTIPPQSFGFRHGGQLITCANSSTTCLIEGRVENPGGVAADWIRIKESVHRVHHDRYVTERMVCPLHF
jgi:hypothetical protein